MPAENASLKIAGADRGDGVIDETDLLLFSTEYAARSRRADMDRSGVIDVLDYNIYMDEYAKRPK